MDWTNKPDEGSPLTGNDKVRGITLWPFIFLAEGCDDEIIVNHERIHIAQANETAVVGMYIVWVVDFLRGCIKYGNAKQAYLDICLEKEAHANEKDLDYLNKRRLWAWAFEEKREQS